MFFLTTISAIFSFSNAIEGDRISRNTYNDDSDFFGLRRSKKDANIGDSTTIKLYKPIPTNIAKNSKEYGFDRYALDTPQSEKSAQ